MLVPAVCVNLTDRCGSRVEIHPVLMALHLWLSCDTSQLMPIHFWWMCHAPMVSTLATAVDDKMCLWNSDVTGSKSRSNPWCISTISYPPHPHSPRHTRSNQQSATTTPNLSHHALMSSCSGSAHRLAKLLTSTLPSYPDCEFGVLNLIFYNTTLLSCGWPLFDKQNVNHHVLANVSGIWTTFFECWMLPIKYYSCHPGRHLNVGWHLTL